MILCLHHNDADGHASAAIVRRALGPEVQFYEMNYGDPVPWERVESASQVVMVDFSLPAEEMERLAQTPAFTWIDHHITSLEELAPISTHWNGLRDVGDAACVLTWRFYFPEKPIPRAVILIGDRDIWRWSEANTGAFTEGLHQLNTCPENHSLWERLLDDDGELLQRLIDEGALLRTARLNQNQRDVESYGFRVEFEGYSTLAINQRGNGEMGSTIQKLGYTLAYCYVDSWQNGRLMTFVTLYSEAVDVAQISQKFGGGGHRGAAGFSFERGPSPFPPGGKVRLIK